MGISADNKDPGRFNLAGKTVSKTIHTVALMMLFSQLACITLMGINAAFHAFSWESHTMLGISLADQRIFHQNLLETIPYLCLLAYFLLTVAFRVFFVKVDNNINNAATPALAERKSPIRCAFRMLFLAFGIVALVLMVNLVLCIGMAGNLNGAIRSVLFQISFPPNYGCA
ncbi:MAG: hypothetical protein LBG81_08060 [Coriobacteriaceae bacterium]|nr:hypothetical protein [Coriobacteriaceae bacterium]